MKRCNQKFTRRFGHIETQAQKTGKKMEEMTLEEMNKYRKEAKDIERGLKQ